MINFSFLECFHFALIFPRIFRFHSYSQPTGKRCELRYCVSSVKQCSKIMIWCACSGKGVEVPRCKRYIKKYKLKNLKFNMNPRWYTFNMMVPHVIHQRKQRWSADYGIEVIGLWSGSSPDFYPIENSWDHQNIDLLCSMNSYFL